MSFLEGKEEKIRRSKKEVREHKLDCGLERRKQRDQPSLCAWGCYTERRRSCSSVVFVAIDEEEDIFLIGTWNYFDAECCSVVNLRHLNEKIFGSETICPCFFFSLNVCSFHRAFF